jgi:hypothetical protein
LGPHIFTSALAIYAYSNLFTPVSEHL